MLVVLVLAGCGNPYHLRSDLSYGPHPEAVFDHYVPRNPEAACPAVIAIHGGAWMGGDKRDCEEVARRLCIDGYVVLAVNYRLAPNNRWPAQIDDCLEALRYFRANAAMLHIDPRRIGAFGVSAGGHLAAMLALRGPDRVKAAVCSNGEGDLRVYGVEPIMANEDNILESLLGPPPFSFASLADASPTAFVRTDTALMVLHSTRDGNVYYNQGVRLHDALRNVGATTEFIGLNSDEHGRMWLNAKALGPIKRFLADNL